MATTSTAISIDTGWQNGQAPHTPQAPPDTWQNHLLRTKGGDIKEAFSNLVLTLQHTEPWSTASWYDVVREVPMVGDASLSDQQVAEAALAIGQRYGIAIHNLKLVQSALVYVCRLHPRDMLQEWLQALPPWDNTSRLT